MKKIERLANLALAGLALAPLVVKVDPNLNVVLTACLTVFVGCYRSIKPTPPSLLRLGVNLKNFSTSTVLAIYAILFHLDIVVILLLYVLF